MVKRLTFLITLFVLVVVPFLFAGITTAQGTAPANGCLQGSASDWLLYAGTWDVGGYGACGAIKYYVWQSDPRGVVSRPFVVNSGSTLTFWAKMVSWGGFDIKLINWEDGAEISLGNLAPGANYAQSSFNVSGAGQKKSIHIVATGGDTTTTGYFSDFQVSNASVPSANLPGYINGAFNVARADWFVLKGGASSDDIGHSAPPSRRLGIANDYTAFLSIPFIVSSSSDLNWSAWFSGTGTIQFWVNNLQNNTWSGVFDQSVNCPAWCEKTWSLSSGLLSNPLIYNVYASPGANVWIDDVCPASGCLGDVNPPTPTPTATGGGGGSSYPTLDWSGFPTYPPFPTFPAFPTQVPFPTSIYGPGTAIPITGSVSITGMVKIDDRTPVRVKIDDSTPVAVRIGPDPNYTPQNPQTWAAGVSQSAPPGGSGIPTLITSPSQSQIQYGQAGAAVNPINFAVEQIDLSTPDIPMSVLGVSIRLVIHYIYPTAFSIAGIDILPGLYALGAVFILVFLFRQLQEK